ncbi:MAG TPA: peptide chain release factor 2 [Candidatus Methylacidiphilales bacterium]|nr:peptide chain release factor 2 [Candidatus Methylacidiphilales bacterium]
MTSKRALRNCGGFFDKADLAPRLAVLEEKMAGGDFWNDQQAAQKVIAEANQIKGRLEPLASLISRMDDLHVLGELALEDETGATDKEVAAEQASLDKALSALELKVLLGGPLDPNNAIISLHAGAGGTEACDWASMLLRMYQRFAERSGFKIEILDIQSGEEAGVKTATLHIKGDYAFGKLKAERGVHRLVRISPFNSAGKRQTSFASLDVVAEVSDDIDIVIEDKDLRVDVYRSGGPGGQGVNTTDSAVRITHMPSGLIVTCQNERSQIKNRATAMNVLKARLYQVELDKKKADADKMYGEKGEIGWGRQIRSYVLQPYQSVKDLRTGEATSDVQAVLDGELDNFIDAFLRGRKRSDADEDDE